MPIDPLPPPPQRNDAPSDFADKGDAFLSALPAFAVQAEAARLQAVAASEAAPAAVAAANYRGEYAAGTTYTVGQSVSYAGDRWAAKKTNLGITPADGADWLRIVAIPPQSGQGGKYLRTDGTNPAWAASMASGYQEFTASGNWTVPDDATWVAVHCVAGGGSGCFGSTGTARGGAGGEGWYRIFRASDLPSTVAVVIGAGGAPASGSLGNDGGNSSFNGVAALGGSAGGSASGSLAIPGNRSNVAISNNDTLSAAVAFAAGAAGGPAGLDRGGRSVYGGGGGARTSGNIGTSLFAGDGGHAGADGGFPGGGGGGVTSGNSTKGGDGVVRIWWW